ncbi:methyltransferase-domain-containing protein [Collybia nuda]|uniref:Ribosomal RNA-processing protein 8 n=1 Tax=Collybia nuda TaxID=64659 RepID=A0A9P5YHZ1_9AGAR|nr:methyltransferase-domain-containing protein [Collybia nuda]
MAFFDIPGWTVSTSPVAESSQTKVSKKRKRPPNDSDKLQSAEINLDKLVRKLKWKDGTDTRSPGGSEKKKVSRKAEMKREKKSKVQMVDSETKKKTISRPMPLKAVDRTSVSSERPAKRQKMKPVVIEASSTSSLSTTKNADGGSSTGLTALQKGMKQSLDGARFRIINESLYKTDSKEAHQMIRNNTKLFEDYHTGFRHQVQAWPTNPVEHYISAFKQYPLKTVIADLGCGDAALARSLLPLGMIVLSFDLMSDGKYVVEADTCGNIPLPGSEAPEDENSHGEGHIVDVVVCALSLMGTNWPNCLREAWRILKVDGELKIAEVASRFTDVEEFQALVGSIGFRLKLKDDSNSHFTLFEFKKVSRKGKSEGEWAKVLSRASILKPCEYKRR